MTFFNPLLATRQDRCVPNATGQGNSKLPAGPPEIRVYPGKRRNRPTEPGTKVRRDQSLNSHCGASIQSLPGETLDNEKRETFCIFEQN